jgi:hypothetical protein
LAEPRAADTPVAASITPGQDGGGTATGVSSYVLPSAIWKATTEFTMADDDQSMGSSAVESHGEKLRAKKWVLPPECWFEADTIFRPSNKARLRCTRAGCSLTFPRPYELNRHVQNVHERSVNLTCPVYGCNRTSKPYGRIDNFIGHLRKHKGAQNILCLFQGCNIGPLSPILLAKHLISYHLHEHGEKPYIYKAMEILSPDILRGHVLFGLTAKQQEGKDACPLASLGCLFRLSVEHLDMEDHLKKSHDIVHRAKFYDAIVDYGIKGHDLEFGRASCVICQWEGYGLSSLLWHLKTHSEEEYRENAKELYDIFLSWIFKIGPSPCFKDMDKLFSTLQKWYDEDSSPTPSNNSQK